MADKDTIHDLAQHAVDAVTGLFKRTPTVKAAYTSQPATQHLPAPTKYSTPASVAPDVGTGIAAAGAQTLAGEKAARDKAIQDAS